MTTSVQPHINPRIARVLMPLAPHVRAELKASIEREGVRDPVVVWAETGDLLDGRNRVEISAELGLPFPAVHELSFASEPDAVAWVLANQLARRNLTPREQALIRGRIANMAKRDPAANLRRGKQEVPNRTVYGSEKQPQPTSSVVAAVSGVSPSKVEKDARYARAVDKVAERFGPEAANEVVHGPMRQREVVDLVESKGWAESLADLREHARKVEASRKPRPHDPKDTRPWFQRTAIRETLERYTDDQDGEAYCDRVQLTCSHWHTFKRRTLKCGKSYPCEPCGSGTRRPHAVRVVHSQIRAAVRDAVLDPTRLDSLLSFVEAALQLSSLPHADARGEKASEDVMRYAQAAGLLERERGGSRRRTRVQHSEEE